MTQEQTKPKGSGKPEMPWEMDNNLMIVTAKGDYVATIDASEKGWRARAQTLLDSVNHADKLAEALRFVQNEAATLTALLDEHQSSFQIAEGIEGSAKQALADYDKNKGGE